MLRQTTIAAVLLVVLSTGRPVHAQDDTSFAPADRHAVYVELIGNGLLYSLNYEYRFNEQWNARVGASLVPVDTRTPPTTPDEFIAYVDQDLDPAVLMPLLINRLFGSGRHQLEIGAGALLVFAPENQTLESDFLIGGRMLVTGVVGYRYQHERGFLFRAGLTPAVTASSLGTLAGISFGYAF